MKKHKTSNWKKYAPPENYYDITASRRPSKHLSKAVGLLGSNKLPKTALDFGCGAGSETKYLVEHDYEVVAVDGQKDAEEYIKRIRGRGSVRFELSDFEGFEFGSYALVNSSNSLSFAHKNYFENVMKRLLDSILPGGLFVGNIFGDKDQWNKPGETMTFMSNKEVKALFDSMTIIDFEEFEGNGTIATGEPKYWHKFNIIARK